MRKKFLTLLMMIFATSCAGIEVDGYEVAERYAKLSAEYDVSISVGDYDKAYSISIEQLRIDPSDTVAYLRMAIASQYLDVDKIKLLEDYSPEISERDSLHLQIKSIANALLKSPRN